MKSNLRYYPISRNGYLKFIIEGNYRALLMKLVVIFKRTKSMKKFPPPLTTGRQIQKHFLALQKWLWVFMQFPQQARRLKGFFSKGRLIVPHTRGSLSTQKLRETICLIMWEKPAGGGGGARRRQKERAESDCQSVSKVRPFSFPTFFRFVLPPQQE